ncbi:ATP-binding protein [Bacillus sp. 03113]|uniref:ATP-binding protein n=1 Tax=Bacillus sp. 03113 TaxID=2578211 RepID=UPI001142B6C0|nr:ATP-binding protein [Bacillus sp. 03113]
MRDVSIIPFSENESIIVAVDNSGAIGMKEYDELKAPYSIISYFAFRTSVMECIAAGGHPFSVIIHNLCDDDAWLELVNGVQSGLEELGFGHDVHITGSTESNFSLKQSVLGMTVLGKAAAGKNQPKLYMGEQQLAVIGLPLVGKEVMEKQEEIAPLSLFYEISRIEGVIIIPVGSKGILYELNQFFSEEISDQLIQVDVDVLKSSGPSTCFIVSYPIQQENVIKTRAQSLFHPIRWI